MPRLVQVEAFPDEHRAAVRAAAAAMAAAGREPAEYTAEVTPAAGGCWRSTPGTTATPPAGPAGATRAGGAASPGTIPRPPRCRGSSGSGDGGGSGGRQAEAEPSAAADRGRLIAFWEFTAHWGGPGC